MTTGMTRDAQETVELLVLAKGLLENFDIPSMVRHGLLSTVLNVLIICEWKCNRGEYVRFHEGCSYDAHNQGGNAYNESTIVVSTSLQEEKMALKNIIGAGNDTDYRPFERVQRKETRIEKNYVNMDERFHIRGNISCGKSSQNLNQAPRLCNHNLESYLLCMGNEDDKAILASCSFSPSILEYILGYRRRKGVGSNTCWIEKEESMKPSLLEKSSKGSKPLQARIGIHGSVEIYIEEEISRKDPCNLMSEKHIERKE
ncbi:hypothetical protein M9H77_13055 [Catharanthus roseus]|uniref:Uncharacterized protein n=1 Tax=Catharanthus roseus TaxID=4058 RepID=A0ACC0BJ60_CATRO|nr:hypothetical protein M9H77_13055 [Catharanthus roseus]